MNNEPFEHNNDYIRIRDIARLAAEFGDSSKVDTSIPFRDNYKQVKNSFQSEIVIAAYLRRYIDLFNELVDDFNALKEDYIDFKEYVGEQFDYIQDQIADILTEIDNLRDRVGQNERDIELLENTCKELQEAIDLVGSKEVVSVSYDVNTQILTLTKSNGETITTTIPQFDESALLELINNINKQIQSILDTISDLQNQVSGGTTLEGQVNSVGGQLQGIGIDINQLSYGGSMIYDKLNGGDR